MIENGWNMDGKWKIPSKNPSIFPSTTRLGIRPWALGAPSPQRLDIARSRWTRGPRGILPSLPQYTVYHKYRYGSVYILIVYVLSIIYRIICILYHLYGLYAYNMIICRTTSHYISYMFISYLNIHTRLMITLAYRSAVLTTEAMARMNRSHPSRLDLLQRW